MPDTIPRGGSHAADNSSISLWLSFEALSQIEWVNAHSQIKFCRWFPDPCWSSNTSCLCWVGLWVWYQSCGWCPPLAAGSWTGYWRCSGSLRDRHRWQYLRGIRIWGVFRVMHLWNQTDGPTGWVRMGLCHLCLAVGCIEVPPLSGQHVHGWFCCWRSPCTPLDPGLELQYLEPISQIPGTEEQQHDLFAEMSASAWSSGHTAASATSASDEQRPPGLASAMWDMSSVVTSKTALLEALVL